VIFRLAQMAVTAAIRSDRVITNLWPPHTVCCIFFEFVPHNWH